MKISRRRASRLAFSLARCLGLGVSLAAVALPKDHAKADVGWNGSVSTDWNNVANYSGNPAGQNVFVNATPGTYPVPVISADQTFTPVDIFVGNDASTTARLDHRAGAATTGNGNWMYVGVNDGVGTYNLANTAATGTGISGYAQGSGSMSVAGSLYVGGFNGRGGTGVVNVNTTGTLSMGNGSQSLILGELGNGTLNFESGTINAAGEYWMGNAPGGTGTINQTGGTANVNSYLGVGRFGNGTYNLSAGTVNAAVNNGVVTIGGAGGTVGVMNVSGSGVLNATDAHGNAGSIFVGEGWTGTGTASGTLNVSGNGLVNAGTQNIVLGVNNATDNSGTHTGDGTVNLNGGVIQAGAITQGTGTGTFNFNGGTLTATQNSTTFLTGLTTANVRNGGAKINTNGFNVTIGQALNHSLNTSDAATDGGLAKSGAGNLMLAATSSYTGPTTVTGGTLELASAGSLTASRSLTLSNTATLTLDNATALPDTLTMTLVTGSTLNLSAAAGTTETIGTLLLNGTPVPVGTYTAAQLTARAPTILFTSANGETLRVTSAVPEPSAFVFGAVGLAALVGWGRRRQTQAWLQRQRVS